MSTKPKPAKFQLSFKSLIVIYLLVSCNIGLFVYDSRLGMFAAICLLLGLGVVYFEKYTVALIVVCAFMAGFFYLGVPIRRARQPARPMWSATEQVKLARMLAETNIQSIARAIEHYRLSKGCYPDDSSPQKLYVALQSHDGDAPDAKRFLSPSGVSTKDQDDQCLTNSLGALYIYKRLVFDDGREQGFILIDPGPDELLGGTIDPVLGFVSDNSGADKDNIVYDSRKPYDPLTRE